MSLYLGKVFAIDWSFVLEGELKTLFGYHYIQYRSSGWISSDRQKSTKSIQIIQIIFSNQNMYFYQILTIGFLGSAIALDNILM